MSSARRNSPDELTQSKFQSKLRKATQISREQ